MPVIRGRSLKLRLVIRNGYVKYDGNQTEFAS